MDPITTALVAATARLAEPAIRDSYEALKALIRRRFGADGALASAVQELEAKPESAARKAVVQEEVAAAGADRDAELLRAVEALLERARGAPGGHQEVHQTIHGDRNIVGGTGDITVNMPGS
jgi:hypothetical protein